MTKQYIAAGTSRNSAQNHVPAPLFQRKFNFHGSKAAVMISCAGIYRLFLNGKELTRGLLAPYFSNPTQVIFYDEYDVTDCVVQGENKLEVLLGNGFVNVMDFGVWNFNRSPLATPCFYLRFSCNGETLFETDEHFQVGDSPITFDDLHAGERYDARNEEITAWRKPCLVDEPKGILLKNAALPVVYSDTLQAKSVKACGGGYLYDFGENNTGVCTLRIRGTRGQQLDLYFGEVLVNGELSLENIIFAQRTDPEYIQHDVYILKDGEQEYTPSFTYHGFRYVFVKGLTQEQATRELLTYRVMRTDLDMRGSFTCSDSVINAIEACTKRSDVSNFIHYPTDCPHREKNGWTGDIALSAEQLFYHFVPYENMLQWLRMMRLAQLENGGVSCIIPCYSWGYDWGTGMGWDSVIAELPEVAYRFTGDSRIVKETLPMITRYLPYLESKLNADGLTEFGLGDWLETGRAGQQPTTPKEVTDSLLLIGFYRQCARLFALEGDAEKAAELREKSENVRLAFRKKYGKDGALTLNMQTALVLALKMGVFDKTEEENVYRALVSRIHELGDSAYVGAIGLRYLFEVLSEHGDDRLALHLIAKPEYPSFGYEISRGATTLPEIFLEYVPDGGNTVRKDGNPYLYSFNHHFFGAVSGWFYKVLAGIDVSSYGVIRLSPHLQCGLDSVQASFSDGAHQVRVSWKKQNGGYCVTVENSGFTGEFAPFGTEVCVTLCNGVTQYIVNDGDFSEKKA